MMMMPWSFKHITYALSGVIMLSYLEEDKLGAYL